MKAELIDVMGSDLSVVNAARVSFDKESEWVENYGVEDGQLLAGRELSEKDQKLISYLARNNHFTPFTHCVVTLRETVPIFVARQRFKHTVGFSYNEVSRRYVDDTPVFFVPDTWRHRADDKKQGSSDEEITHIWYSNGVEGWEIDLKEFYSGYVQEVLNYYDHLIKGGVAPEQARMVLPQSMYTSYYVTGSLYAFARAYNLRSDSHAQKEIQDLASEWKKIIQPLFPVSWTALCES
jgi:thymidylate synthase (FAD)